MSELPAIKICGLRDRDMLEVAIDAGADMVGFVHFEKSPRHLPLETLGEMISAARDRAETVVLLVNPDATEIAEISALAPDWIQLHGKEPPHRVAAIGREAGLPILKALPIGGPEDVAAVSAYAATADRLLLDARPPKGADRPGGLGQVFDWSLLAALDPDLEFMLSGGLTPANVAEAIRSVRPFGVDVSSGVERAPGQKDAALIAQFVDQVRASG